MEGTAAHWVTEQVIRGMPPTLGTQAPNRIATTREMLEGAHLAIETFEKMLGPGWPELITVERTIRIPRIHPTHCWGTPDYYAWFTSADGRKWLFVFDYKFGFDVVDVVESEQITAYSVGLMSDANIYDEDVTVMMVVIQPRAYHRKGPVRTWSINGGYLRAQVNVMAGAVGEALGPDPRYRPSVDGCKNCSARHVCEANQRSGYEAIEMGKRYLPLDMSPLAIGRELRAMKEAESILKSRISGLEAQVENMVRAGTHVPFWVMQSTSGRLGWNKPAAEVFALGDMLGKNLRAEPEPITPTQAIKAGMPADLVNAYAIRPSGVKLAFDDGTDARLTFSSSDT